jgi:general secretion pathway protein C
MKRCFVLFNLMLITGMAYLGVDMFYRLATAGLSTMPMVRVAKKSQPPSRGNAKANISGYRAIVERNLFNTQTGALSGKISESAPLDTLKPTELKLKLFGTVTGNNSGYAVIEDGKTRQQTLYRSGDLVQEALVKKILRDKVVLAVKGKDEILVMEDISNNSANAMARGRPAAQHRRKPFPDARGHQRYWKPAASASSPPPFQPGQT